MMGISGELASFQQKNFRGGTKMIDVRVSTMDAELEFKINSSFTGQDLFNLVTNTIGLREVWFFGLYYVTANNLELWVTNKMKVSKQHGLPRSANCLHFFLLVKFYPESVEHELIQDVTRHLVFLEVSQKILTGDVFCPAENTVLLASYAIQAKLGDYDSLVEAAGGELQISIHDWIPSKVISQFDMTEEMWISRILPWWQKNQGMSREAAELEYLKFAEDLEMFGIQYFPIFNKKESNILLGLSSFGIGMFEKSNRLKPKTRFDWSEIRNISFKNKRLFVHTIDGSSFSFCSQDYAVNKMVLDLCVGAHWRFISRRRPDSLEIQQMKAQTMEENKRREQERSRFENERKKRIAAEAERDLLQEQVSELKAQLDMMRDTVSNIEKTAELLAEKARVSEEEALLLAKRASEAEAEMQRVKIAAIKNEEAKIMLAQNDRRKKLIETYATATPTPIMTSSFGEDPDPYYPVQQYQYVPQQHRYSSENSTPLTNSPPRYTTGEPLMVYGAPPDPVALPYHPGYASNNAQIMIDHPESPHRSYFVADDHDGRSDYAVHSRHLQEQLAELRDEIECLKVDERQTEQDRIYVESRQQGEDKYTSLRKTAAGSARTRIQLFDGM